jgi:hypothetical protein
MSKLQRMKDVNRIADEHPNDDWDTNDVEAAWDAGRKAGLKEAAKLADDGGCPECYHDIKQAIG